jgi:hypothetical protein
MKSCNRVEKECSKHGLTEHVQERNGYFRCKRCRNDHVIRHRQDVKLKLVEEFGGKCNVCGYSRCVRNLSFHHRDPEQKDFGIAANGQTTSYEKLLVEARKCVLLCANCHGEVHAEMITI